MYKLNAKILIVFTLLSLISCQKKKSEEAFILNMRFDFGEVTFDGFSGSVNAPENTDLKKLKPEIKVSKGAVVYPPSKAITDFTHPVDYTVTAEDGVHINYYTVSVFLPVVKFVVYDCTDRTPENPYAVLAPNTTISIYQDVAGHKELIQELKTDEKGEAFLYGYRDAVYYFLAERDGAVNIIDGYIIAGIFESEQDIELSPAQPQPSNVGDLKFMDVNQDQLVNEDDRMDYRWIWELPANKMVEIMVYIARN